MKSFLNTVRIWLSDTAVQYVLFIIASYFIAEYLREITGAY